jgi:hypothetical protein
MGTAAGLGLAGAFFCLFIPFVAVKQRGVFLKLEG